VLAVAHRDDGDAQLVQLLQDAHAEAVVPHEHDVAPGRSFSR